MIRANARKACRGQAAVMVTLALPVVLGLTALVVDLGWCYWRQEVCKTAAQSAAMGAGVAAYKASNLTCGSGVACGTNATTYTECPSSPATPPSNDIQSGCLYAQMNGFSQGGNKGRQSVKYAAYTSSSPVTGSSPDYWVRFVVGEKIPLMFAVVLGNQWQVVSAAGTAGVFKNTAGACLYALDNTADGAITLKGTTDVEAGCGVWDNSNSSSSLSCTNNTTLDAGSAKITLAGGNSCRGTVSPAPLTNQARAADPFASVPTPSDKNRCDSNGISAGQAITMPADGTFEVCGDISLTGNGTTTLPAGLYYVKNGGLDWHNGSISGTGVTIFLTGSSPGGIAINGNMTVNLTAPTSGPYRGLVLYQDRGITSPPGATFNGGSGMDFQGSIYLPNNQASYSGGSTTSITALVVDTVTFTGTSYFGTDTNGSITGIGVPTVSLIE